MRPWQVLVLVLQRAPVGQIVQALQSCHGQTLTADTQDWLAASVERYVTLQHTSACCQATCPNQSVERMQPCTGAYKADKVLAFVKRALVKAPLTCCSLHLHCLQRNQLSVEPKVSKVAIYGFNANSAIHFRSACLVEIQINQR